MVLLERQSRRWLLFALAGLFLFGVTNFILGFISEKSAANPDASSHAAMILWLGVGLLGICGAAYLKMSGRGFSGLAKRNSWRLPLIAGVTLALGMFLLKISLSANPLAKGPIVAIVSSNSLIVAMLAWIFLREKLSMGQWAGFLIILAGIALLSLGGKAAGFFGEVGYAVTAMVLFGLTNYSLKLAGEKGSDSITAAVLLWLTVGGCGMLAFALYRLKNSCFPWLQPDNLAWLALLAGIFLGLGMLCLKIAVTMGPSGPAAAVSGSNAVMVSLLDYWLLGHWLPSLKLAGMLVVISGIAALALAKPDGKG